MASAQLSARSVAVAAGIGAAALLTAAATALPAAADSHGNGNSGSHGNSATAPGHTKSTAGSASSSQPSNGHNPPGNNGTVFIHDVANDHSPHNVPHVSCNFWVDFFNFDTSQSVTVSFAGQAPTGKDTALAGTTTTTLEADDASGAGNDWDGELAFTGDQLGVSNLGAPAHQGYHVKMTVTTNEPGDHKYKVFWIQPCGVVAGSSTQPTTVAGTSTTSGSSTSSANASSSTTTPAMSSATSSGTSGSTTTGEATGGAVVPEAASRASSGMPTEVLGEKFTRGGSTPAAGATASRLPFTGAEIGAMSLAAAVALGGGALLLVAGRRRRRVGSN